MVEVGAACYDVVMLGNDDELCYPRFVGASYV